MPEDELWRAVEWLHARQQQEGGGVRRGSADGRGSGSRRRGWMAAAGVGGGGGRAPEQSSRGLEEAQEGDVARGVSGGKDRTVFLCNQWHWWVIIHQLHEEVQKRWFWSCKRSAQKLHPHLHYISMELAAPMSFGAGVFGWNFCWSC